MLARLLFACLLFAAMAVVLAIIPQPTEFWNRVARENIALLAAGIIAVALYRSK